MRRSINWPWFSVMVMILVLGSAWVAFTHGSALEWLAPIVAYPLLFVVGSHLVRYE